MIFKLRLRVSQVERNYRYYLYHNFLEVSQSFDMLEVYQLLTMVKQGLFWVGLRL